MQVITPVGTGQPTVLLSGIAEGIMGGLLPAASMPACIAQPALLGRGVSGLLAGIGLGSWLGESGPGPVVLVRVGCCCGCDVRWS
jgi:hypothetical protein